MKLINKTDANLNIALIAKNMAKSDAQKVLMGRVLFMMDNMPTVEAIPKADYEARLRADMMTMLEEIQLEIEELEPEYDCNSYSCGIADCYRTIQEKITSLKENKDA